VSDVNSKTEVAKVASRARAAGRRLASLPAERRNGILLCVAAAIEKSCADILAANSRDCETAQAEVNAGRMTQALFDRLRTDERGVADMATKVRTVAELTDPLGRTLATTELDNNLTLAKVSCPLGVVGIVFESRPDVIPQIGALCLKSGNAVLLKGGKEAANTNEVLARIWRDVLADGEDDLADAVNLLHRREDVRAMLELRRLIDLVVPRGSKDFVNYVAAHSSIPVLGHGEGICHIYVDQAANLKKAWNVAFDAKTNYPAACNAVETLLVHEAIAPRFLPQMTNRFHAAGVEVRGCERTRSLYNREWIMPATDEDWATEYSDLIIAVKVIDSFDEAVAHIDQYGSLHTEAIITEDPAMAERFMELVDAAGVYHNASTRFADGFRYGLGAELGISTSKLHARGPVGLEGLTTYKYKLFGNGHTVSDYETRRRLREEK
jgi:glutamate-5-semialdehyde dehydrogenase